MLPKDTEKRCQKILETDPNNVEALHLLAIFQFRQNNFAIANDLLTKALSIEPDNPILHNSMGNVLKTLEKFAEAIHHYHIALKLNPNYETAYNNLGNIFLKQGDLTKAKHHYLEAIKAQPDFTDPLYNLALISLKQNKSPEALTYLNIILEVDSKHAEALHQKAQILYQQNDLPNAIKFYEKYLELEPTNPEALYNLANTFLRLNILKPALKYFLRLLPFAPTVETYYNIGVIYLNQGLHSDALQYLHEALKINPDHLPTHVNLGAIYLKTEDHENARKHYQEALRLEPNNQEYIYILNAISQNSKVTEAPSIYIKNLFDQYAPYYDQHLQLVLKYHLPELLYDALIQETNVDQPNWSIVDLGCGTGLAGKKFKPLAKHLIGVDLSEKMLEIAKQKEIYDELFQGDLSDALKKYHALDLIIIADTLVYVGDLTTLFQNCKNSLKQDGLLLFSIEKTYEYPFILQKSARFAHTQKYIDELAIANSFKILRTQNIKLRLQNNVPIEGYIYILKLKA